MQLMQAAEHTLLQHKVPGTSEGWSKENNTPWWPYNPCSWQEYQIFPTSQGKFTSTSYNMPSPYSDPQQREFSLRELWTKMLTKQANEKRGSGISRKAIRSCLKAGNKYIKKTGAMKSHSATCHRILQQRETWYLLRKKGHGKMFMGHFWLFWTSLVPLQQSPST